jgi:hypothetical protein
MDSTASTLLTDKHTRHIHDVIDNATTDNLRDIATTVPIYCILFAIYVCRK